MKNLYLLEYFVSFLLLYASCSKSPECWGTDKDKGLIKKSFPMADVPICLEACVEENMHLVIRDTIELLNALDTTCNIVFDPDIILFYIDIDFNSFCLLGFWATGGCETDFIREVVKDEDNKKYIYTIKIKECGLCQSLRYDANLVLVPKLEDDYIVEFEFKD